MNKLLLRSSSNLWRLANGSLRPQLLSVGAATASISSASSAPIDSLQRRISTAGHPSISMVSVIEKWLDEGKTVDAAGMRIFIKQLRANRRYNHALQISEWMNDQGKYELLEGDIAVRLDLIAKVHGWEKAEAYFDSISESSRGYRLYGSLLNCYVQGKQMEKAETLLKNMKDLGFVKNAIPYNVMLGLYSRMHKYDQIDALISEMEEKGIEFTPFTFNTRLQAYAACSDIDGMENLLNKMEVDPLIKVDFHAYLVVANSYLKSGLIDKSLKVLRKSEQLISENSRRSDYECLLTTYAAAGSKAEVFRVWNLYKRTLKFYNSGYICIISSLVKLDDLESAEKIWDEWYLGMDLFDIRVPNLMISAYSKKGYWEKAEAILEKIRKKGEAPNAISWDHMAVGYLISGQTMKAVESIKKSISTRTPGRVPDLETVATCLKNLRDEGDKEEAEELLKVISKQCRLPRGAHDKLSSCVTDENFVSNGFDQIEKVIVLLMNRRKASSSSHIDGNFSVSNPL